MWNGLGVELPREVEHKQFFNVEATTSTTSIDCFAHKVTNDNLEVMGTLIVKRIFVSMVSYAKALLILVFFSCSRTSKSLATDEVGLHS